MGDYRYSRGCIRTHLVGRTATQGERIVCTGETKRGKRDFARQQMVDKVTMPYSNLFNATENHVAAAQMWLDKFQRGNVVDGHPLKFNEQYFHNWKRS